MKIFTLFLLMTHKESYDWLFGGTFSTVDLAISHFDLVWKREGMYYNIYEGELDEPSKDIPVATNWTYEKEMIFHARDIINTN